MADRVLVRPLDQAEHFKADGLAGDRQPRMGCPQGLLGEILLFYFVL